MQKDKTTLIDNLTNKDFTLEMISLKEIHKNKEELEKYLSESITDLSIPLEIRLKAIEKFYKEFGEIESIELINRLSIMYQMSGTKILETYMYELSLNNCKIPIILKLIAAKSLCYFNSKLIVGYEALDNICKIFTNDSLQLSTPIKIDAICLLMLHSSYKKQSIYYFCNIINNVNLQCDYRYKTILSLENKDIEEKEYYIKEIAFQFFNFDKNQTLYKILAGQLIIQKYNPTPSEINTIESTLFSFANDTTLEYNLRADSCDVILKLGRPENKIKAKEIIMMLGRCTTGNSKNIFENAQNVHNDNIEESVIEAMEFLSNIEMKNLKDITFEYVKKRIDIILKQNKPKKDSTKSEKILYKNKLDAINISFNRIYLDRAIYSKFNYTLSNILIKVWAYISSHTSKTEMKKRLIEELIDMSGTCSSGFAGRLINVISGFGDFNIKISWRDQIIANFTGRLNAKARDIDINIDINCKLYEINKNSLEELESFKEKVLEEMIVTSSDYNSRLNFLKFFRKNMLSIRDELYSEFKLYITDTDFDLYFRSAISSYETGSYV